jgi:uncharacterized protein with von Willebrand factor type A (vWA) domain
METSNILFSRKGVFLYEVRKRLEKEDLTEWYILKQFSLCKEKMHFNNFVILFPFVEEKEVLL